jgi:hypothetical protein
LLIKAYLKANGENIDNITTVELSRRFGIDESVLRKAEKDLEK